MPKSRPDKYKQYNEEKIISEIKRYRLEGYSDKDIIGFLEIPRSTFYDYIKRMYDQDKALYEENRKHAQDMLREEVQLAKERLLESYRRLKKIAEQVEDDAEVKRQDKADVEGEIRETVIAITKLMYEKPVIVGESNEPNSRETSDSKTAEQQDRQAQF